MSKVGKKPIIIPDNAKVSVEGRNIKVSGPKGEMARSLPKVIDVIVDDGQLTVKAKGKSEKARTFQGTFRAIIANMLTGVTEGWTKNLEMNGTGYRAELQGNNLVLTVGFSHPVVIEPPEEISFKVEKTDITVEGTDKELVGLVAAKIRAVRPPEPYKGKGIKYKDEVVRRKPGKAAKAAGAAL
jgi:large subunit ribosomal protein L6